MRNLRVVVTADIVARDDEGDLTIMRWAESGMRGALDFVDVVDVESTLEEL